MSSPRSPHCLCVRNLHYKTTDDELLTLLRAFCNVSPWSFCFIFL